MNPLPTPGRWYVTWGKNRYYGAVYERDGNLWFSEIPHEVGDPDLIVREDGGIWEKAPASYEETTR